jgi:hypothetical protein
VINPIEIPAHWTRIRGIDWGFSAPFCCLWGARNPDNGRMVVYRELYQTHLTDREQARKILDYTPPSEKIAITYADPSMWGKKREDDIPSAVIYGQNGLYLTQANNDRLDGKRRIDRMLMDLPDGQPGLLVFSVCANLIRTLPALVYDKVQIEDVDTKGEDHPYDALKYLTSGASDYHTQKRQIRQTRSPLAEALR